MGVWFDNTLWQRLVLILNAGSDYVETSSGYNIQIPWFKFRSVLKSFAKLLEKENIKVEYDTFSKFLIYNHLQDTLALQNLTDKKFNQNDILEILNKINFKRKLTKQQLRDTSNLLSLKHGANFSVPGAGKTTTLLAVYSILKNKGIFEKLLVVGPRNAFISWDDELEACFGPKKVKVVRLTGGKKNISELLKKAPEISLITYHQLPIVLKEISNFLIKYPTHLVLDEAHRIKRGMPGIHYSAVIQLADLSPRRDILTGTPMPQSVSDLDPEFNFLWPGQKVLENTLKISDEEKRIEYLNQIVKPLYVRTTKSELGLPKPEIKFKRIELGPAQSELYNLLRSETARILSDVPKDDVIMFRKFGRSVMRLLQIASNPMLITSNDEYPEDIVEILHGTRKWDILSEYSKYEKPAKIEYAIKRAREIIKNGEKVVLWSVFIQNIKLLEHRLSDLGAVSIYGAIETGDEKEAETREGRIRRFHDDANCQVLIGNPAACGEGISLHKIAHHAIYIDRTFNAAHYLQSVDRIHRLGLDPKITTHVEILQAHDTIDLVVESRLKDKIKKMADVLDDIDLKELAYDPEDIADEFPGGIEYIDYNEIKKHILG